MIDATTDDALGRGDATDLIARLRSGEVSPSEARAAALARARAVNGVLNAVAVWVDDASVGAPALDPEAPFAGVPSLLKDNEDLAGYPTSQGSWAVPDRAARESTPWAAQFRNLGLDPIAKTTLPEFGLTASTESSRFGATRNPWNPAHCAGGSSGGSAALVAAGVVPIAHANDGGGSIRIPAACCGLVGLKPTRGRLIDLPELDKLPIAITTQGVVTRTVRDTAAYYAAVELLHRNPSLPAIGEVRGPGPRLRIGVVRTASRGLPVDPETVAAVDRTASVLAGLGHEVSIIDPPVDDRFGPDFLRYWALIAYLLRHGGRRLYGRGFDPERLEGFTRGLSSYLVEHMAGVPGALRRLRRLSELHEGEVFERVDAVLSPVLGHDPPPIGHLGPDVEFRTHLVRLLRFSSFTPLQNVTGSPAIALPAGLSSRGLPIGVHLGAPFGHERRLLELAFELEAAQPWLRTPGAVDRP